MARESIVLFGEGKTEAIFLNHLKKVYEADKDKRLKIKVDKGQGKSPQDVANRLVNKLLKLGCYDRSLLLIDSDIEHKIKSAFLKKNSITLALSVPQCLEGLMLSILGELPKGGLHSSSKELKSAFIKLLNTDEAGYSMKLRSRCPQLFPKELLEAKRSTLPEFDAILNFMGV
ncbi:hypothetical protein [Rubritalea profundi]|uniref:RloB domain-containing protein n=1 Tax=Rubritalea profundi TaxID=1658618 RepID=A0A2S7TYF1_9BACT|nr:hypothetical protein [Rubritalea profundi]PQJ27779.1 hypothetical protein BSZ32_04185 [Rubritalea profundi]